MKVVIRELQVHGFKGSKQAAWTFGGKVDIAGENFTGKTSIAEAIAYALTGQNLAGSSRVDSLIPWGVGTSR